MAYTTEQIKQIVVDAAHRYGISEQLALNQIRAESGYNPNATGPATRYGTAKGLAQFIDDTWARYGSGSPYDPVAAMDAWGKYMTYLLGRYNGNVSLALAAYNAGPGNVDKYGGIPPFKETQNYVSKITAGITDAVSNVVGSITTPSIDIGGLQLSPLMIGGILLVTFLVLK